MPYIFILKALEIAPLPKGIIPILREEMLSFFAKELTYGTGCMFKCTHAVHRADAQMLFTQKYTTNDDNNTLYLNNIIGEEHFWKQQAELSHSAFLLFDKNVVFSEHFSISLTKIS